MFYQDYRKYVKHPYSDNEKQIILNNWNKLSAREIALITGRSTHSVQQKAKSLGLAKYRHFTPAQIEFIRINKSTLTAEEIGRFIGRSKQAVLYIAGRTGISLKKLGENNRKAKLSDQDIDYIRELREDYGLTLKSIADKFEVHEGTVSKICSYKAR